MTVPVTVPVSSPSSTAARCPRGCVRHNRDTLVTAAVVASCQRSASAWAAASAITLVRTVACVALALLAIRAGSGALLGAALAVHWIGDIADGLVARARDEETLAGAVLDICADRLCVAVVYVGFVTMHPEFAWALAVYLVEFMVVDAVLSLTFLRWPLSSPNYFAWVDPLIFRWNWWPPAKAVNSAVPALLCVWLGLPWVALVAAAALLVVKVGSLVRVVGRPGGSGMACTELHS